MIEQELGTEIVQLKAQLAERDKIILDLKEKSNTCKEKTRNYVKKLKNYVKKMKDCIRSLENTKMRIHHQDLFLHI
jgi:sugar-specific transcriptional regulator TrmB